MCNHTANLSYVAQCHAALTDFGSPGLDSPLDAYLEEEPIVSS